MDFDHDGRTDIVAGTFSGSPYVALGGDGGLAQPAQVLDANGERIVLNQFWNYVTKEWDSTTRCDESGRKVPQGHATSAVAYDWDADGDLDLLLGDYDTGRIYRRVNEGKPGEAKYGKVNLAVLQGKRPLVIPGRIESIRLVDWDRDGAIDLVCGSADGDTSDDGQTGVYWVRNSGKQGEPEFESPRALIVSQQEPIERVLPHSGFYPDAADVDGDGDWDFVVGASAHWNVPPRVLSNAEKARLAEIEQELASLRESIDTFFERLENDSKDPDEAVAEEKYSKLREERGDEIEPLLGRQAELHEELDGLTFGKKEGYRVLFYENLDAGSR